MNEFTRIWKEYGLGYMWMGVMKTLIILLALFTVAGNVFLAVVNYKLQEAEGLFGKLEVINDLPMENSESFALLIHILTVMYALLVALYLWKPKAFRWIIKLR